MVRYFVALAAVFCLSAAVQAENYWGVVRSMGPNNSTVIVAVNGVDKTLELAPNVRVFSTYMQGRLRRRSMVTMEVSGGLASVQPNSQVLCTTQMVNGKEVVTQIRLEGTTYVRRILR